MVQLWDLLLALRACSTPGRAYRERLAYVLCLEVSLLMLS